MSLVERLLEELRKGLSGVKSLESVARNLARASNLTKKLISELVRHGIEFRIPKDVLDEVRIYAWPEHYRPGKYVLYMFFKFPYDKHELDRGELEPVMFVFRRTPNGFKLTKIHFRVHWRHFSCRVVGGKVVIAFSPVGHTPLIVSGVKFGRTVIALVKWLVKTVTKLFTYFMMRRVTLNELRLRITPVLPHVGINPFSKYIPEEYPWYRRYSHEEFLPATTLAQLAQPTTHVVEAVLNTQLG